MSTWSIGGGFFSVFDTAESTTVSLAQVLTNIAALQTSVNTVAGYVDTEVAAIKAKTDSLNFTVAGQVDANIQYVNDTAVNGAGTSGNPWGP